MNEKKSKEQETLWWALGIAWQLGHTIALPLVAFALGGRFADKYFDSSPLFLLSGILFSIFITSWVVYKKISKLLP